ncbi:MAG: hypothetical protein ACO3N7_06330, partial [Kiritimatiellia bacterium]
EETSLSHPLCSAVSSYLEGLAESGTLSVELEHPFPASPPAPDPVRPRQQPAKVPPVEKLEEKSILPPLPKPEVVAVPEPNRLVWCTLKRLAECGDPVDATQSAVVLVTEVEETRGEHGELLKQILHAAGYTILQTPLSLTHPDDLKGAGQRILALGNPALQKISPAGMDLKVVRGMWQKTPYGKLISSLPPSVLPNNPAGKKAVWQDLKSMLKDLSLEVPQWTRDKLSSKK